MEKHRGKPHDPTSLLLRCLACVVFHSEKLVEVMVQFPGHDFAKIALLHDRRLLDELTKLVTTEPTPGVMMQATGIPPHIGMSVQLKEILQKLSELVHAFENQSVILISTVKKAIEDKSWESGHLTGGRLKEILDTFHASVNLNLDGIREEFRKALEIGNGGAAQQQRGQEQIAEHPAGRAGNMFAYGGRFYAVPQTFQFPTATLREGLRFWLKGQTISTDGNCVVKPFNKLSLEMLPNNLKNTFKNHWTPIFKFLKAAINLQGGDTANMSEQDIESTFQRCVEHLRSTVSYCWNLKKGSDPLQYKLATWSRKISHSAIKKNGTEEDKRNLQDPTNRQVQKQAGLKRKKTTKENVLYPQRQKQRSQTTRDHPDSPHVQGRVEGRGRARRREQETPSPTEEEVTRVLTEMVAGNHRTDEERQAADAMMAAGIAEFEEAALNTRRAGVDDDGNQLYVAPNVGASAASANEKNYEQSLRETLLGDGFLRGHCAINPCRNPDLPLIRRCDGERCKKYVHHSCASLRPGLQFGELGTENERVYCRRMCKPLVGWRRVGNATPGQLKDPPAYSIATGPTVATTINEQMTTGATTITTGGGGNTSTGMDRIRVERDGKVYGHCSIDNCECPEQELNRHHCSNCGKDTHSLCAQKNNLSDDDREYLMYCSINCKNAKK